MLPDPLHPALVHFPVVFAVLLFPLAIGALLLLRRGGAPRRAWAAVVAVHALLLLSSWAALQSGEAGEERVEELVAEPLLEDHEEAAERFLTLVGLTFVLSAAGLARGRAGRIARPLGALAAAGVLAAGFAVGHSGGELVYGPGGLVERGSGTALDAPARALPGAELGRRDDDDLD